MTRVIAICGTMGGGKFTPAENAPAALHVRLRSEQSEIFLCSRTRESSVRFRGRHPNSHESVYSPHTPLTG